MKKWRIDFKRANEQAGNLTAYRVAKETGLTETTVRKYIYAEPIETEYLHSVIITLANFYKLNWYDPTIVQVIDDAPERETPLPEAV